MTTSDSLIKVPYTAVHNENEQINRNLYLEHKAALAEHGEKSVHQSQKISELFFNSSLLASRSVSKADSMVASMISSQNSGGTVTVSPTVNILQASRDVSPVSSISVSGEPIKKKRGRPRTLDAETSSYPKFRDSEDHDQQCKL